MADFRLLPFDPGNDAHADFVYGTFRRSVLGHWPWVEMAPARVMERLRRELAKPNTRTRLVLPIGGPDVFMGWVSVRPPGQIVFAYVKHKYRREFGLATSVCLELGVDVAEAPVGVAFWTAAAARIAAKGPYRLYFDTREAYDG